MVLGWCSYETYGSRFVCPVSSAGVTDLICVSFETFPSLIMAISFADDGKDNRQPMRMASATLRASEWQINSERTTSLLQQLFALPTLVGAVCV